MIIVEHTILYNLTGHFFKLVIIKIFMIKKHEISKYFDNLISGRSTLKHLNSKPLILFLLYRLLLDNKHINLKKLDLGDYIKKNIQISYFRGLNLKNGPNF